MTSFVYLLLTSSLSSLHRDLLDGEDAVKFILATAESLPSSSADISSSLTTFCDCLLDAIWSIDTELEDTEQNLSQSISQSDRDLEAMKQINIKDRASLVDTVKKLLVSIMAQNRLELMSKQTVGLLTRPMCLERLDFNLLVSLGLLEDRKVTEKKEIRVRTSLLWVCLKYSVDFH